MPTNNMTLEKINKALKLITLVALILLAILVLTYRFEHCDKCKFNYEGKTIGTKDLIELYVDKCFVKKEAQSVSSLITSFNSSSPN